VPVAWAIGDSIMDGGREVVEERLAGWDLTLDAEVGRSSSSAPDIARAAVDGGADVVVVELGTNDSDAPTFREHLGETLEILAGVPFVVWQTARGPVEETTIPVVNAAIREVAATYPNVSIADWEAFVPEEAVQTDGIHPDEEFLHLEADLLVPLLRQWRAALMRDGATSCGGRVVRETS
jgi:GDSL-like Lipase/Acylhydrolase family